MTILDALKTSTAARHERVEALLALDDDALAADRYAEIVRGFRALYAPLEARLHAALAAAPAGWRHAGFAPEARRKLPLLDRDLAALSLGAPPDAPAALLPPLPDLAAALGALYVLEGATLGGRVISRRLATLGIGPESGAAFFAGYGEDTGPMWKGFRDQLVDHDARFGRRDDVLAGADATFAAFERWFAAHPATTLAAGARG